MKHKNGLMLLVSVALFLTACSLQQVKRVEKAKDPVKEPRRVVKHSAKAYKHNSEPNIPEARKVESEYNRLMGEVQKESRAKWGKRESDILPGRTRYVKYTESYKNRVIVDFNAGTVLVEHLDEAEVMEKLRSATVVALLTPDTPGAVDLFSDREITLGGTPYLQELVVDENDVVLKSLEDIQRYAGYLVANQLQSRIINVDGSSRNVLYVQMNMVNAHVDRRALQYMETVRKHSAASQVSRSLIYAIIKVESLFNPFAISSRSAFGMMQLVPSGDGREAYRKVKAKDEIPSMEYLFNADNNIELGVAYLSVLLDDTPLSQIRDAVSREYCAIAAYNSDTNNVFRAFSKLSGEAQQGDALDKINSMHPDEVYKTLRTRLPHAKTRSYIVNVLEAKRRYTAM